MGLHIGKSFFFIAILINVGIPATSLAGSGAQAISLKCEHLINPIGIDVQHPRLSWLMIDKRQGARQTAYRLFLSTDSVGVATGKTIHWASAKVISSSSLITYRGKSLLPFTKYYWRVELWDKDGKLTSFSRIS